MKGVLLVNMGGPLSKEELHRFITHMLSDKYILPAPAGIRHLLARYISRKRTAHVWKKYEIIGGTSVKADCRTYARKLEDGNDVITDTYISYSGQSFYQTISKMKERGANQIYIIPLHPQYSICTFRQIQDFINVCSKKKQYPKLTLTKNLHSNTLFTELWSTLIKEHIKSNAFAKPHLLFSAHAIPVSFIKKGDTYTKHITTCAKTIASETNLPHSICYQSKMGRAKWTEPDTRSELIKLAAEKTEIIIIPISFLSENLETLYDLDKELIPETSKQYPNCNISRVHIPSGHDTITQLLKDVTNIR